MLEIKIMDKEFTVAKVENIHEIDLEQEFCFVGKTDEEISIVCSTENTPIHTTHREDGWKAFRIQGELDFSLVGILSKISTILADNHIGNFAISTFNTDYILTKQENFSKAIKVLQEAGYSII